MTDLLTRKNMNLIVGLISLLIILSIAISIFPSIFVILFDTFLGKLFLILFLGLAFMYDSKFAIGLTLVFFILWRHFHSGFRFLL
jgi:hypothetical protein